MLDILGERAHYVGFVNSAASLLGCKARFFPKNIKHQNIVLHNVVTMKSENSKLEEGFSKILENSKSGLPKWKSRNSKIRKFSNE